MNVPRQIFTYWDQGWDDVPPVVAICSHARRHQNPGWVVHALDAASVQDWLEPIPIPEEKWAKLPLPHRSDIIRTQLLIRHGGVWADPTVWFTGSLDRWLPHVMNSGMFVFFKPGRDRLISNWFIAAAPGNSLLVRLYDELCRYWRENDFNSIGFTDRRMPRFLVRALGRNLLLPRIWLTRPMIRAVRHAPYMIYHYLFAELVRSDPECARVWERTPRISADLPHALLRHGLLSKYTRRIGRLLEKSEPALFKLTWKLPGQQVPEDSVLAELFRRSGQMRSFDTQGSAKEGL